MNSIKNTVVTITLLAVGYGAYVVLNSPPPDEFTDLSPTLLEAASEGAGVSVQIPEPGSMASSDPVLAGDGTYPGTSDPRGSDSQAPMEPYAQPGSDSLIAAPTGSVDASRRNDGSFDSLNNELPPAAQWPAESPPDHGSDHGYDSAYGQVTHDPPQEEPLPQDSGSPRPQTSMTDTHTSPVAIDGSTATRGLSDGNAGFEEAWKAIHSNLANSQLSDALFALTVWYDEPSLSPEQSQRCLRLLDQLAGTVIYSRESFLEPAHVVQEGETLATLAERYNVPLEFLARINGIEGPYELYPGESLKVVRGPFRAEVSRQRNDVTVFLGRYYAGRFAARLGNELPNGPSVYEVIAKDDGREFFDRRTGYRVARDDPSNPYGDVWIGLRGEQVTAAHNVGIHVDTGKSETLSVGVSPADAADLNAILSVGSRVSVKE